MIFNAYLPLWTMDRGPAFDTFTYFNTAMRFISRAIIIILASFNTFARWAPFSFGACTIHSTSYTDPNAFVILTLITFGTVSCPQAFFTVVSPVTTMRFARGAIVIISTTHNASCNVTIPA